MRGHAGAAGDRSLPGTRPRARAVNRGGRPSGISGLPRPFPSLPGSSGEGGCRMRRDVSSPSCPLIQSPLVLEARLDAGPLSGPRVGLPR
jgi:hypothetical protein